MFISFYITLQYVMWGVFFFTYFHLPTLLLTRPLHSFQNVSLLSYLPQCSVLIKMFLVLLASTQIILSTLCININCNCKHSSNNFKLQQKQWCIAVQEVLILHGDPSHGTPQSVQRVMGESLLHTQVHTTDRVHCTHVGASCWFGIIGDFYR